MNTLVFASAACAGVWGFKQILGLIVFGAVIGALARLVLPGKQNMSALVTVILGILGALVGYFVGGYLNSCGSNGIDVLRWVVSVAVAAVLVVLYGMTIGKPKV